MNSLRFWCNSLLSPNKHHSTGGWYEPRFIDAVPLLLFIDHRRYIGDQILVVRAFSQKRPYIMVILAEKAGAKLAVRGQPYARAMPAKRLRHRRNQADFPRCAVLEAILARRFATLVRNLHERPSRVDTLIDLRCGYHLRTAPVAVRIQRHILDKPHNHAGFSGEPGEGFHLIIIDPAHQHRVHLYGRKARSLSDLYAFH